MTQTEQLSASLEDYLEAIFNIISDKGAVRAKDIAKYLGVKAGSVTVALKALSKTDHINYQPYEVITLTSKGLEQAKEIIRKHEILKDFFVGILGADPKIAEAGACKIEHVIPERLIKRLISFTEFIQACPRCGSDMIEKFHGYFNKIQPCEIEQCQVCLGESIDHLEKEKEKMSNSTTQTTLLDIPNGSKCIVKSIKKKASATKRLVEIGISRGEYPVLEARKKCQHGTVFDEVFLTLPGQPESLFTMIAEKDHPLHSQDNINNSDSLDQRFIRFSGKN